MEGLVRCRMRESSIILGRLDEELVEMFKEQGAILAGGAITSIMSGAEVNDWDIYFPTPASLIKVLVELHGNFNVFRFTYSTEKSFTGMSGEEKIQLIKFDGATPEKIFEAYDFTINMMAYDFVNDEFVFHTEAMKHCAQRRLIFNNGTSYPMVSALRVIKYLDRGYTISKKEMFKLLLAVSSLNINSWEEAKKHISGMYGVDSDTLFDTEKEWSMEEFLSQLEVASFLPSNDTVSCLSTETMKFIEENEIPVYSQKEQHGLIHVSLYPPIEGEVKTILKDKVSEVCISNLGDFGHIWKKEGEEYYECKH